MTDAQSAQLWLSGTDEDREVVDMLHRCGVGFVVIPVSRLNMPELLLGPHRLQGVADIKAFLHGAAFGSR